MSYADDLYRALVTSSIWRAPDHVRLVWITMLGFKNEQGVVITALPSLAAFANVTIDEAEDAIRILMLPDPYSRTKDNEGRRLSVIDGGWQVLNHSRYADAAAEEERKYRDRKRQRSVRERHTDRVTGPDGIPVPQLIHRQSTGEEPTGNGDIGPLATSESGVIHRPTTYLTEAIPDAPPGSDGPATVQASSDPSQEPGLDRDHLPGRRQLVTSLLNEFLPLLNAARDRVAAELSMANPPRIGLMDKGARGEADFRARLATAEDPRAALAHVLEVAALEALKKRSLRWLSWSMFHVDTWASHRAAHPDEERRQYTSDDRFSMGNADRVRDLARKLYGDGGES